MPFEMDAPDADTMDKGGTYLATPGTYHFKIDHVDEHPVGRDKQLLDGFRVELSVLDGPRDTDGNCLEASKKIDITFFNPKLNSKDNGEFARRKQAAFLIAAGLIDNSKLGQRVSVELSHAINRQLVAEVERGTDEHGQPKKFLELAFANIYHVDDPKAASCPKNAKALALLPKELRRDPVSFKAATASGGNGAAKEQPAKQETKAAAAASAADAGVNLDDI